jgi:predicted small lipoprotein YifL
VKKFIALLLMAAFLLTGVAGCGDSSPSKPKDKDVDPAKPGEKGRKDKPA